MNRGLVGLSRRITLDDIEGRRRANRVGLVAEWRLDAFRCPDCHHDVVSDMQTGEVWDLDLSDYGDAGSTDPAMRWTPE